MEPRLESFLQAVLDDPVIIADHTWQDGNRPIVLEMRDRSGRAWFVKQLLRSDAYHAELTAYQRWTQVLGGRTPELHAFSDDLQALVITALPGSTPGCWEKPELQRQAGRLLRRLHDTEQFPRAEGIIARKLELLDKAAASAPGLVDPGVVDFARSHLRALEGIPPQRLVPCHLDYSPRNWLVEGGRLYVFDFGDSAPDAWISDIGRLFIGWRLPTEGKEAFVDGYGRTPSPDDLALLRADYAARLIRDIVFAHGHGYTQAEAGCRRVLQALMNGEV